MPFEWASSGASCALAAVLVVLLAWLRSLASRAQLRRRLTAWTAAAKGAPPPVVPPVVAGLPLLGSALALGSGGADFLRRCREKVGGLCIGWRRAGQLLPLANTNCRRAAREPAFPPPPLELEADTQASHSFLRTSLCSAARRRVHAAPAGPAHDVRVCPSGAAALFHRSGHPADFRAGSAAGVRAVMGGMLAAACMRGAGYCAAVLAEPGCLPGNTPCAQQRLPVLPLPLPVHTQRCGLAHVVAVVHARKKCVGRELVLAYFTVSPGCCMCSWSACTWGSAATLLGGCCCCCRCCCRRCCCCCCCCRPRAACPLLLFTVCGAYPLAVFGLPPKHFYPRHIVMLQVVPLLRTSA